MRLVDADELMEHVWRDKLNSRELIAEMIDNAPTVKEIPTAYLHAINYTLYGEDVTEKWVTATQQAAALERAYNKGYYDALQRQRIRKEDEEKITEFILKNGYIVDDPKWIDMVIFGNVPKEEYPYPVNGSDIISLGNESFPSLTTYLTRKRGEKEDE